MAVLKDLIVHGPSRFVGITEFTNLKANKIKANEGVFNKLIATTADFDSMTANNATVVGLLDVKGELHTNSWTNSNIATIEGNFYITPTISCASGTFNYDGTNITLTAASGYSFAISSLYVNSGDNAGTTTAWSAYSEVLITGQVAVGNEKVPLGTIKGRITSTTPTTSRIIINSLTDGKGGASNVLASIGTGSKTFYDVKVSLLKRGNGSNIANALPIGIYMTAMGKDGKTFIDIYGGHNAASTAVDTTTGDNGGLAKPILRIGNLAGLPKLSDGTQPLGYGIYTSNGYFTGTIVSTRGKIGGFVIDNNSIHNGTFGTANSVLVSTGTTSNANIAGSGSINGWAFTAGTTYGVTKTGVLYATNAHIKGAITADSLKIGTNNTSITTDAILNTNVQSQNFSEGTMLYKDPMFASGTNNTVLYDNSKSGKTTWTRSSKSSDNPMTGTSYEMVCSNTGTGPSPGLGGFYWAHASHANAVFLYRIIAKIPTGHNLIFASNATGNSPVRVWLTPNAGKGTFTEYVFKQVCGSSGSFSTSGFFYIDGTAGTSSSAVTWRVAYAAVYDMTNKSEVHNYITSIDSNRGITIKPTDSTGNDYLQINSSSIDFFHNNQSQLSLQDSWICIGNQGSTRITMHARNDSPYIYMNANGHDAFRLDVNGVHIYDTNSKERVLVNATGMIVKNAAGNTLATYGDSIVLYRPTTSTKAVEITSSSATFSGVVTASALRTGSKTAYNSGNGTYIDGSGNIYVGNGTTNNFRVTAAGAVTAANITVTGGKIGGLAIDSTSIHTNGVAITSNADNSIGLSSADFTRTINGTSRAGLRFAIGDKFGITGDGILYCAGATIGGYATTGNVSKAQSDAITTAAADAKSKADAAAKTATNYIADINSNNGITIKAIKGTTDTNATTGNYIKLNAEGLDIYQGGVSVAEYGATARIGAESGYKILISPDGLQMTDGLGSDSFSMSPSGNLISSKKTANQKIYKNKTVTFSADISHYTIAFSINQGGTYTKATKTSSQFAIGASFVLNNTTIKRTGANSFSAKYTGSASYVHINASWSTVQAETAKLNFTGANTVLWSGAWYMKAAHTATLSEPISAQLNGIVLVWSAWDSGVAKDQEWYYTFVAKNHVLLHNGQGVICGPFATVKFGAIGTKYVYVYDDKIVGHDDNGASTSGSSISFKNSHWVLRYVYGV